MNKLMIMAIAVVLLSGCASYPRYSVVKGSHGGWLSNFQEKRHVDPALAETGATWSESSTLFTPVPTGECRVLREYKDKISSIWNPPEHSLYWLREDVGCVVWDATHSRPRRYGPF
jgi:hypothetical protein